MIRINLLPHREAKRKQNKNAFYRLLVLAGVFGILVVIAVAAFIATKISDQDQRNAYFKGENKKLDEQIAEIATLEDDITALKARQAAVEDLQSDRNQPVYLLDELVKQVPEGVFLRSFKQDGQRVSMVGVAQSNERVSELLHNFSNNSPWLERPELGESKAGNIGQGRDAKKVFEFTMSVSIKRLRDKDSVAAASSVDKAAKDKSTAPAAKPDTVAKPADNPADKTVAPIDKSPAKGDKATSAKGAANAVASGAAVDAPKKP
jgi:type IV pilus assembly protein PilN